MSSQPSTSKQQHNDRSSWQAEIKKGVVDGHHIGRDSTVVMSAAGRPSLQTDVNRNKLSIQYIETECKKCIFCNTVGAERLIECEGDHNAGGKKKIACRSKFHLKCVMKYNHGGFLFQYAALPECQNKLLCPLHCCHVCNSSGYKQSAYVGKMVECFKCLRAFHEDTCIPSGCEKFEAKLPGQKNWRQMIECPSHGTHPSKSSQIHITQCHLCDNTKKAALINCSSCARVFHTSCHNLKTWNGLPLPPNKCDFCLKDNILIEGTPVLAKYQSKFYFAIIISSSMYPDQTNKKLGTSGHCVVQWPLENNKKSIVSIKDVVHLTRNYKNLAKTDKEYEVWMNAIKKFEARENFPVLYKDVAKEAKSSDFYQKPKEPILSVGRLKKCECTGLKKCLSAKVCELRSMFAECPPSCPGKNSSCFNRFVSDGKQNSKMERRKAGVKGYGVYATGLIRRKEKIAEYVGELINSQEREKRMRIVEASGDLEPNRYMMQASSKWTVDAARVGNIARYFNHSCDPNCVSFPIKVFRNRGGMKNYEPRLLIRAIREIGKDEEITINYMMHNENHPCKCRSANCTGRMINHPVVVNDESDDEDEETDEKSNSKPMRQASGLKPKGTVGIVGSNTASTSAGPSHASNNNDSSSRSSRYLNRSIKLEPVDDDDNENDETNNSKTMRQPPGLNPNSNMRIGGSNTATASATSSNASNNNDSTSRSSRYLNRSIKLEPVDDDEYENRVNSSVVDVNRPRKRRGASTSHQDAHDVADGSNGSSRKRARFSTARATSVVGNGRRRYPIRSKSLAR